MRMVNRIIVFALKHHIGIMLGLRNFSKILHMHGMCAPSARRHAKRRSRLLRLNQTAGAAMLCVPFARKLLRHAKKLPLPASQMVLLQLVPLLTAGVLLVDLGPLEILHPLRPPAGGRTEAASKLRFLQLLEFVCVAPNFVPKRGLFF